VGRSVVSGDGGASEPGSRGGFRAAAGSGAIGAGEPALDTAAARAAGAAVSGVGRQSRGGPVAPRGGRRGPGPFRLAFCPGPERHPGGDNDVLVSATTATPAQSRTSFSASLGTTKDARKIGKNLFPVHRKATISPSAASKV
jgi:hypothetical protein